jgi:hypothetical protein
MHSYQVVELSVILYQVVLYLLLMRVIPEQESIEAVNTSGPSKRKTPRTNDASRDLADVVQVSSLNVEVLPTIQKYGLGIAAKDLPLDCKRYIPHVHTDYNRMIELHG